jgi:peptide deformylase
MRKEETENEEFFEDSVYINPVMKKMSKSKKMVEEGCLSVRYLYGKVNRSTKATIEAYDENGNKFTKGGSGLLAQIFQHEYDHLNGILFIDKAKGLEEIPPKQILKK